jgi:hypothetical protein
MDGSQLTVKLNKDGKSKTVHLSNYYQTDIVQRHRVKRSSYAVRCFLQSLCGQPDKYITSGFVFFDVLVPLFAQLPYKKQPRFPGI